MQACVDFAKENGGHLHRHQGGFWAKQDASFTSVGSKDTWFGATTIEALVLRGQMEYTDFVTSRAYGKFPVRASVINKTIEQNKNEQISET